MSKIYYGYFVLIALAFVMAIAVWGGTSANIDNFWRMMYFICADVILFVIILGMLYITWRIEKEKR